jgi:hypothetical protein
MPDVKPETLIVRILQGSDSQHEIGGCRHLLNVTDFGRTL